MIRPLSQRRPGNRSAGVRTGTRLPARTPDSLDRLHPQGHAIAAHHPYPRADIQLGTADVPVRVGDLHASVSLHDGALEDRDVADECIRPAVETRPVAIAAAAPEAGAIDLDGHHAQH